MLPALTGYVTGYAGSPGEISVTKVNHHRVTTVPPETNPDKGVVGPGEQGVVVQKPKYFVLCVLVL